MKIFRHRLFAFASGAFSLLALLALVANLGSLAFKPGTPFVFQQSTPPTPGTHSQPNGLPFYIFVVILAAFLVGVFFMLPKDARKRYLLSLLRLVIAGFAIFLFLSQFSLGTNAIEPPTPEANSVATLVPAVATTPEPEVTPSVYSAPHIPAWVSYVVGLGFLLVVVASVGWILWRQQKNELSLNELAKIARSALDDLDAGKDWGDTVLTCYYRMTRAVERWRGLHRRVSMTPSEFADTLTENGLPREAVQRLTGLFERIRYGGRGSSQRDVEEASQCLTSILEFCEATK